MSRPLTTLATPKPSHRPRVPRGVQLAQADEVLASAAQVLQTYLDNQPDPAAQAVYLQQPHHQALWAAWQARQGKEDIHKLDVDKDGCL